MLEYHRLEYALAAAQLALAMFGMGATLRPADFVTVFRVPRALLVGLGMQIVGVPAIAVGVNQLLTPPPGVAFGLILVAVIPGGAMSNVLTYFARGNVALSIALTTVVTLGCLVSTPVLLRILGAAAVPVDLTMPVGRIAFDIVACLLAPLACGMAVGAALPARRSAVARWAIRGSLVVVLAIIVGSARTGHLTAWEYGGMAVLAVCLLALSAQQVALVSSLAFGLSRPDTAALTIEVTIRNVNLGLLVKAAALPAHGTADPFADMVLFVILMYGAVALPLSVLVVVVHRALART